MRSRTLNIRTQRHHGWVRTLIGSNATQVLHSAWISNVETVTQVNRIKTLKQNVFWDWWWRKERCFCLKALTYLQTWQCLDIPYPEYLSKKEKLKWVVGLQKVNPVSKREETSYRDVVSLLMRYKRACEAFYAISRLVEKLWLINTLELFSIP